MQQQTAAGRMGGGMGTIHRSLQSHQAKLPLSRKHEKWFSIHVANTIVRFWVICALFLLGLWDSRTYHLGIWLGSTYSPFHLALYQFWLLHSDASVLRSYQVYNIHAVRPSHSTIHNIYISHTGLAHSMPFRYLHVIPTTDIHAA